MKKVKKYFVRLSVVLLLVGLGSGIYGVSRDYFEISKQVEVFTSLFKKLHTYYVDEINTAKLMRKSIDAMLKSLDPYTVFISESEIEDYRVMTTGEYGGIGAVISKKGPHIQIVEPYEDYPAYEADLRAGDILLEVDGKSVEGKSTQEVSQLLKGQPGTNVNVLIRRPGVDEKMEKSLIRKEVHMPNVPYYGTLEEEKDIGYIRFSSFRQNSSEEVKEALKKLIDEKGIKGVVLDLRGNPGGILNEAVKTVALFVKRGELVVRTKGKVEDWNKEYHTYTSSVDKKIPLVVLVNGHSASASEIVSGAVQDLDRGVVVGRQTFGKGLVQQAKSLPYNAKIKMTIAKYYIPSGRCIQAIDYSNRNENGKTNHVPDSLKRKFKTRHGRAVYDGDGIAPDIKVKEEKPSEIAKSLLAKQLVFDYATFYRNSHDSIAPPADFELSDQEYQEFTAYLKENNYHYTTGTEKELENFKKIASKEQYFAAVENEYAKLKQELEEHKANDLQKYREELKDILEEEIVGRYYYQKGRIKESLEGDPYVEAGVKILKNKEKYYDILKIKPPKR